MFKGCLLLEAPILSDFLPEIATDQLSKIGAKLGGFFGPERPEIEIEGLAP